MVKIRACYILTYYGARYGAREVTFHSFLLLCFIEIIIEIYRHIIAFYRIIISINRNTYSDISNYYSDILTYYCVLSN